MTSASRSSNQSAPAAEEDRRPAGVDLAIRVVVKRSGRRKRTISWRVENQADGVLVEMQVPATLTGQQEAEWRRRVEEQVRERLRRQLRKSDRELLDRARALARKHLGGELPVRSVSWSDQQQRRWGSCTPDVGSIRLSSRLQACPDWVLDYVIVHELAHIRVPGHSAEFWSLVNRYPLAERARGFLMGFDHQPGAPAGSDA